MTLTVGSGPFGHDLAGEFNVNLAWTYLEPLHDAAEVADHVAFFNERVEIEIDGEIEPPVRTPWSDPDWWKGIRELEAEL